MLKKGTNHLNPHSKLPRMKLEISLLKLNETQQFEQILLWGRIEGKKKLINLLLSFQEPKEIIILPLVSTSEVNTSSQSRNSSGGSIFFHYSNLNSLFFIVQTILNSLNSQQSTTNIRIKLTHSDNPLLADLKKFLFKLLKKEVYYYQNLRNKK